MKREPDAGAEILAAIAEYEKEAAGLLKRIGERDEMIALLRVAKPSKIAALRDLISRLNRNIERAEHILSMHAEAIAIKRDLQKKYQDLDTMLEKMKPDLLKHIAEHQPERLAEMKALFDDADIE